MEPTTASVPNPGITGPTELFSSAWKLFSANWQALVPIAVIPQLLFLVANAFNATVIGLILGIPLMILGLILSLAMAPAMIDALSRVSTSPGMKLPLVGQYKIGFGYFWAFLLICILQSLILAGSTALFIIPGIIVSVYIYFSSFTLVLGGKRGLSVFTESYSLVAGRWWPVFGRFLFLGLCMFVFMIPMMILAVPLGIIGGPLGSSIVGVVISAVITPISLAYIYGLYNSLKAARSAEVSTNGFKKWLITFIVIGILMIAALIVAIPGILFLVLTYAKS